MLSNNTTTLKVTYLQLNVILAEAVKTLKLVVPPIDN